MAPPVPAVSQTSSAHDTAETRADTAGDEFGSDSDFDGVDEAQMEAAVRRAEWQVEHREWEAAHRPVQLTARKAREGLNSTRDLLKQMKRRVERWPEDDAATVNGACADFHNAFVKLGELELGGVMSHE